MFRQVRTVALMLLVALGSLTLAAAQEAKEAGGKTKSPPKEVTVDLGNGVKLEMVLIPAGEFLMGSPDSDKDAFTLEKPQHRVRITVGIPRSEFRGIPGIVPRSLEKEASAHEVS